MFIIYFVFFLLISLPLHLLSPIGIVRPSSDSTKVYAAVGSAVTLPCVYTSSFIPSDQTWERLTAGPISPSTPLPLPPLFNLSSQLPWDKSVDVAEVGPEDEGSYKCSGIIKGRRMTRNVQLVTTKGKLHILKSRPTLQAMGRYRIDVYWFKSDMLKSLCGVIICILYCMLD